MSDVSVQIETLPDGREVVVIGDPHKFAELNDRQGVNDLGFQGTCGLASVKNILGQFGIEATENDVVRYAAENGLCNVSDDPSACGGTSMLGQTDLLIHYGIPAEAQIGMGAEDLADAVETGRGIIAEVNAGILWNDPSAFDSGSANHAVTVTGVARDPGTGSVAGFFINDSGPPDSGRFVDIDSWGNAWRETGGCAVVTSVPYA